MPWARPLAVAAFFVAGLIAADRIEGPASVWLAAGIAGAAALAVAAILHRRHPRPEPTELLPRLDSLVVALTLAGIFAVAAAETGLHMAALGRARLPALDGSVALVEGRVAGDPSPAGRATRFVVRVAAVHRSRANERISIRAYGPLPTLHLGDAIRVEVKIRRLDRRDEFDERLYRRRITAEGTASGSEVRVVSHSKNPLLTAANSLRNRMNRLAIAGLGRKDAGLVLGLTIGDERLIPEKVRDEFSTTGLSHLTAVSGANVAMVLGAVILLLRAVGSSRRTQIAVGLATIGFFALVTRGEPSVLRASVMASLALAAFLFGRRHDPLYGLVLAFVGLLAFDPFMLWSIGFQLSFAAALGILVITPRVLDRLKRWPRPAAEALAVAVGAQLAVTPLLAFHFGQLSLVAVPANLVAFPLVAPITVVGFAAGVAGTLWEPLGRPLMEIAGPPVALLRTVAHAFASMPGASVGVGGIGLMQLLAAYLLIAATALWLWGRRRTVRYPLTVGVVIWILAGLVPTAGSSVPQGLRATFFDVGQGDAALVESAAGVRVLIDGGPDPDLVAEKLRRRAISRLDLVVFSHAHFDHVNGLGAVLDGFEVKRIVEPGVPDPLLRRLLDVRRAEPVVEGDRFLIADLVIDVLGPSAFLREMATDEAPPGAGKEGSSLNDASIVLRIQYAGACLLFTGDVEEVAQENLAEVHRDAIHCAVLKAPHHGSSRIASRFVEAADPGLVVISVGHNDYGHPSRAALSLFERSGARVLRTDRLGDVVLEVDRRGRVGIQ